MDKTSAFEPERGGVRPLLEFSHQVAALPTAAGNGKAAGWLRGMGGGSGEVVKGLGIAGECIYSGG